MIIFATGKWTTASRIPPKMWFLNALIGLSSESHFLGKSATLPFPEFILTNISSMASKPDEAEGRQTSDLLAIILSVEKPRLVFQSLIS